ncbi:MAG: Zn-dependent hydrolase [Pedobacter sp.]|nr:MAG: Zn-dependent hydrolase [Pedobacter sp.]
MKIKILKAFNGDAILITHTDVDGEIRNILIDGGVSQTYLQHKNSKGKRQYGELKEVIESIRNANQNIDLLILTHIDDDHIDGILGWFSDDKEASGLINEVWFNSGRTIAAWLNKEENKELNIEVVVDNALTTSVTQGIDFAKYIFDKGIWDEAVITQGKKFEKFGLVFKILSPNNDDLNNLLKLWKKKDPDLKTSAKNHDYNTSLIEHIKIDLFEEDNSPGNGSSIAFILSDKEQNYLFLGDAHPTTVVEGLSLFDINANNPIECKLVKIAHHGSSGNTSIELLACIRCEDFIISTDGRIHQHPHKQMLARLINQNPSCKIHFNYIERAEMIFSDR